MYFLCRCNNGGVTQRTSHMHAMIYHGTSDFVEMAEDTSWRSPGLFTKQRQRMHVSRSGRFVPDVFSPYGVELVVSNHVRERLARLKGVDFEPVVFEYLIDLELPPIGELGDDELIADTQRKQLIHKFSDVPDFHAAVGDYWHVIMPSVVDLEPQYTNVQELHPAFSRYSRRSTPSVRLDFRMLDEYPIIMAHSRTICLSTQAFSLIAPHLDFDFYAVDYCLESTFNPMSSP